MTEQEHLALFPETAAMAGTSPAEPGRPRLTERDMLGLLHDRFAQRSYNGAVSAPRYVCAEHVRAAAGFDRRTADFIAVDTWESTMRGGTLTIHGVEVKTSRGDWRRELADPGKAATSLAYASHRWLAAADETVARPGELPDGWGLLIPVTRAGVLVLRAQVRAAPLPVPHLDPSQVAALLRAVARTVAQRPGQAAGG